MTQRSENALQSILETARNLSNFQRSPSGNAEIRQALSAQSNWEHGERKEAETPIPRQKKSYGRTSFPHGAFKEFEGLSRLLHDFSALLVRKPLIFSSMCTSSVSLKYVLE